MFYVLENTSTSMLLSGETINTSISEIILGLTLIRYVFVVVRLRKQIKSAIWRQPEKSFSPFL